MRAESRSADMQFVVWGLEREGGAKGFVEGEGDGSLRDAVTVPASLAPASHCTTHEESARSHLKAQNSKGCVPFEFSFASQHPEG